MYSTVSPGRDLLDLIRLPVIISYVGPPMREISYTWTLQPLELTVKTQTIVITHRDPSRLGCSLFISDDRSAHIAELKWAFL